MKKACSSFAFMPFVLTCGGQLDDSPTAQNSAYLAEQTALLCEGRLAFATAGSSVMFSSQGFVDASTKNTLGVGYPAIMHFIAGDPVISVSPGDGVILGPLSPATIRYGGADSGLTDASVGQNFTFATPLPCSNPLYADNDADGNGNYYSFNVTFTVPCSDGPQTFVFGGFIVQLCDNAQADCKCEPVV